ncbi:Sua5/YciO/YrdC/YwlC family protein [Avibacterium sp. 21-599]|uniref:Sua5/YciO/YrdC/YwlC family protein n=1 Tax=Avibacterium sp. 21-599 TaxID=2911528 RepID=UPI00224567FE|nr:Sua5/YciO/YrdC/YwlC family protein [Avibacterium sp. 21-599]MCW9718727.1 Sua5/YciO/YrdC/YwlC family protein [Avibacterium sp. 21-599]
MNNEQNIAQLVELLKQNEIIAYPTEAVFGLGCNPLSESAVQKLLLLKQRPVEKGLILIAPQLDFLLPFIDEHKLNETHWQRLNAHYDHPTTWVVPAKPTTPKFLTGQFSTIAVRISDHPAVKQLCEQAGFALTSTSANLTGLPPCRTYQAVKAQFGEHFPVLEMVVGNATNPSEIRDLFTQQLFRQG